MADITSHGTFANFRAIRSHSCGTIVSKQASKQAVKLQIVLIKLNTWYSETGLSKQT